MFTTRTLKAANLLKISSLSIACMIAAAGYSLGGDARAEEYLKRSMFGDYKTNIVAILKQRQASEKGTVIVKIQKSKDGKTRENVTSPLHLACVYLDDGESIQTYSPDDKTLVVQPAIQPGQDLNFRFGLVLKNYNLKSEKTGKKIAGRSVITVTANSKFPQIADIRYYFDEKSGFPLSKEFIAADGDTTTEYEVMDIQFPQKLEASIFKIEPPVGFTTLSFLEPTTFASVSAAKQTLGFSPIMPSQIPFGFTIQKMTTTSDSKWKALCIKLTDGLQRMTVYEWIPVAGESIKTGENRIIKFHNGINIMIVSDIDSNIKNSVMRSFVARAEREGIIVQNTAGF